MVHERVELVVHLSSLHFDVDRLQRAVSVVGVFRLEDEFTKFGLLAKPEVIDLESLAAWHVRSETRVVSDELEIGLSIERLESRPSGVFEAEKNIPRTGTWEVTAVLDISPARFRITEVTKG